jgi:hypothetical protein
LLAAPAGTAVAFAVATISAVAAQALTLWSGAGLTGSGIHRTATPCSASEASSA